MISRTLYSSDIVLLNGAKGADSFKIFIAISSIDLSPDEIRISELTKLNLKIIK